MIEKVNIPAMSLDNDNLNALHYSALKSSLEAISYLLNAGINPSLCDNNNKNAFWYAEKSRNPKKTTEVLATYISEVQHDKNIEQRLRVSKP